MILLLVWLCFRPACDLHVCGDDPLVLPALTNRGVVISTYVEMILFASASTRSFIEWSPRMWRWSWISRQQKSWWWVISTYVEMIPIARRETLEPRSDLHVCGDDPDMIDNISGIYSSDLHVCGDDPKLLEFQKLNCKWSPRMWRWSYTNQYSHLVTQVISTYVEMILGLHSLLTPLLSDLHVCGDDPSIFYIVFRESKWSPRMWRWSYQERQKQHNLLVISTYVEMILHLLSVPLETPGDLHVCGDDP